MTNFMKTVVFLFFCFTFFDVRAQDFLDGNFTFSESKESYFTLNDGIEVVGKIDKIKRKKGLIEEITIRDTNDKKIVFKPEMIHHMYIAPSKWDKFGSGMNKMYDMKEWEKDKTINQEHIKEGYALFETSEVMIKDDKMSLLLQLLNPGFAEKIRVYFDPRASETASVGIGGFTVAGGDAKSYYVKKGKEVAFKLEKKNYEKNQELLYGDCKDLKSKFKTKKLEWTDLAQHIYKYTTECNQ